MNKMYKKFTSGDIAFLLLSALCLLPGFMFFELLYAHIRYGFDLYKEFALKTYYSSSFSFIGVLMLLLLMGNALRYSKDLKIKSLISYLIQNIHILFLILFILWALVATLCSEDVYQCIIGNDYRNEGFLTYIYYGCIVGCCFLIKDNKRKLTLLKLLVLTANFVAFIMMLEEWNVTVILAALNRQRSSVFINPNHLGYYLNVTCTLSIGLYLYSCKIKQKITYLLCYVWQYYVLIVNDTMGGLLATLIGAVIIYVFFIIRKKDKWQEIIAPIIATTILIIMSGFGLIPSSAEENMFQNFIFIFRDIQTITTCNDVTDLDPLVSNRGKVWRIFLSLIPEHPWVGIGPDTYHKYYMVTTDRDRPANEYLSHAVFLGIPALCFYMAALVSLFIKRIREFKKLPATVIIAAGSLIAYLISALVGNTMYYTVCYLYMLFGIIASMDPEN